MMREFISAKTAYPCLLMRLRDRPSHGAMWKVSDMARYIDADALYIYFDARIKHAEMEGLYNTANVYERCLRIVKDAPTADVAPRAEVAREIFWEIDKLLLSIITDDEEGTRFVGVDMQKYYALKMKYTATTDEPPKGEKHES